MKQDRLVPEYEHPRMQRLIVERQDAVEVVAAGISSTRMESERSGLPGASTLAIELAARCSDYSRLIERRLLEIQSETVSDIASDLLTLEKSDPDTFFAGALVGFALGITGSCAAASNGSDEAASFGQTKGCSATSKPDGYAGRDCADRDPNKPN
jgi:hypothetical protein